MTFLSRESACGFDQQTNYETNKAADNGGGNSSLNDREPGGRWVHRKPHDQSHDGADHAGTAPADDRATGKERQLEEPRHDARL